MPGLPAGNIKLRRFLPLSALTDVLWNKFGLGDWEMARQSDKNDALLSIIKKWCCAILEGTEDEFIKDHDLPQWRIAESQTELATTAQAATAAATTSSNLNDDNLQGDGVGIVCGMCVSDSDDLQGGTSCDEGSSDGDMDDN